jgi:hypothetical protein
MFAAGCGQKTESSSEAQNSETTVAAKQTGTEAKESGAEKVYTYKVANTKVSCATNIKDFIKDKTVDLDKLAEANGWSKTDKAGTWSIPANGKRYLLSLADVEDGVYTGINLSVKTMDKKQSNHALKFAEADKDSLYKFGDAQLSEEGIAVTAYALENTQNSDDADPFNITFSRYKDDKGVYKLTNK